MERREAMYQKPISALFEQDFCDVCRSIQRLCFVGRCVRHIHMTSSPPPGAVLQNKEEILQRSMQDSGEEEEKQSQDRQNPSDKPEKTRTTPMHVKGIPSTKNSQRRAPNHGKRHAYGGSGPERSFLGSSVYYGGPDDHFPSHPTSSVFTEEIKVEVKKLEEAMDPLNLECTTRGNWWEGSLYY
eukprot:TRINITY_DN1759_c0_g1_i4.p1 TRINITY_DN1759_c0_g1~~TRINITY_DN1759_c0_g1_i4.p1  ORF type:complete len:184 (+),score=20.77 TRINITY_DN1759_c0_g1_i4:291-842(+)